MWRNISVILILKGKWSINSKKLDVFLSMWKLNVVFWFLKRLGKKIQNAHNENCWDGWHEFCLSYIAVYF